MPSTSLGFCLLLAMCVADLSGQSNDPDPRFGQLGNGGVAGIIHDPATGIVYIGGDFTLIRQPDGSGGTTDEVRAGLAAFAADGSLLPWAPSVNAAVLGMRILDGTLYIMGDFSQVNGVPRARVAALSLATGVLLPFDAQVIGPTVNDVALIGGTLYLGGLFTNVGGQPRSNLAAVDAVSGALAPWNPGANSTVKALASDGSTIFIGGQFGELGGQPRAKLGAVGSDGTLRAFAPAPTGSENGGMINTMALDGGVLYVGGYFEQIGGATRTRFAALDPTTGNANGWDIPFNQAVLNLDVDGGQVYAAGIFTDVAGQARNYLTRINADGTVDPWAPTPISGYYAVEISAGAVHVGAGYYFVFQDIVAPTITSTAPATAPNNDADFHLLITGTGFATSGTYPPGTLAYAGHGYRYETTRLNHDAAQAACETMGGTLAVITSTEESDQILALSDNSSEGYWIGLDDIANPGTWAWITAEPVTFAPWAPSEPNNLTLEHCTEVYRAWGLDGQWNNLQASAMRTWACEFHGSGPLAPMAVLTGPATLTSTKRVFHSDQRMVAIFDLIGAPAGMYSLTVTNADGGTVTSTDALNIIPGPIIPPLIPPTITIDTPAADSFFDPLPVTTTISGTATDDQQIVSVTWTMSGLSYSGVTSGTTAWSFEVTPFHGTNTVTVTATDNQGLSTSTVLVFTVVHPSMPIPMTNGQARWLLHLGDYNYSRITGYPTSGQSILWDELRLAGWGPEYEVQPHTGVRVGLNVATTDSPLVWTPERGAHPRPASVPSSQASDDEHWYFPTDTAQTYDNHVGYYGLWVTSPTAQTVRLRAHADDALQVWLDGAATPILDLAPGTSHALSADLPLSPTTHFLVIKHYGATGTDYFGLMFEDATGTVSAPGAPVTNLIAVLNDPRAPTVNACSPADGGSDVLVDEPLQISFDEPMDTSVAPGSVAILSPAVAGTWSWPDRRHLCFVPTAAWPHGAHVTVTIAATQAQDTAGNILTGPTSFAFDTIAGTTSAPSLASLAPATFASASIAGTLSGDGFTTGAIARLPGWETRADHHYVLRSPGTDWVAAQTFARQHGGHLATLGDAGEDAFVWQQIGRANGWIGFADPDNNEMFTWVDGTATGYANWAPGEPNNFTGDIEDRGIFWWGFQWNDVSTAPGAIRPHVIEFDQPRAPRVVLHKAGHADVPAIVTFTDSGAVQIEADLGSDAVGTWSLTLTNPDGGSAVLDPAFTVTTPPPPDTTGPVITITSPVTTGVITTASPVLTVTGTASDPAGVALVDWAVFNSGMGWFPPFSTASGTTNWSFESPLQLGRNTIIVRAHDGLAHIRDTVFSVHLVIDTAPTVAILVPTTAESWLADDQTPSLNGIASDELGIVSVTWQATGAFTGNGACATTITSALPGMEQRSWSTDLGLTATSELAPGQVVLTITATDTTGHSTSDTLIIEVPGDGDDPRSGGGSNCGSGSAAGLILMLLVPLGLGRRRKR